MSIFYCHHCDCYIDSDYSSCYEDPNNPLELICEDYAEQLGLLDEEEK